MMLAVSYTHQPYSTERYTGLGDSPLSLQDNGNAEMKPIARVQQTDSVQGSTCAGVQQQQATSEEYRASVHVHVPVINNCALGSSKTTLNTAPQSNGRQRNLHDICGNSMCSTRWCISMCGENILRLVSIMGRQISKQPESTHHNCKTYTFTYMNRTMYPKLLESSSRSHTISTAEYLSLVCKR